MDKSDGKIGKIVALCWAVVVVLTIGITLLIVLPDWDKDDDKSERKTGDSVAVAEKQEDNTSEEVTEDITEAASEETSDTAEVTTEATTENITSEDQSLSAGMESDYIIADSGSRYLTESDLDGLDAEQLRLARNEIYARHGRRFQDETLQAYFDSKPWYNGTIEPDDFSQSMLNDYEIANADLIKAREDELN